MRVRIRAARRHPLGNEFRLALDSHRLPPGQGERLAWLGRRAAGAEDARPDDDARMGRGGISLTSYAIEICSGTTGSRTWRADDVDLTNRQSALVACVLELLALYGPDEEESDAVLCEPSPGIHQRKCLAVLPVRVHRDAEGPDGHPHPPEFADHPPAAPGPG